MLVTWKSSLTLHMFLHGWTLAGIDSTHTPGIGNSAYNITAYPSAPRSYMHYSTTSEKKKNITASSKICLYVIASSSLRGLEIWCMTYWMPLLLSEIEIASNKYLLLFSFVTTMPFSQGNLDARALNETTASHSVELFSSSFFFHSKVLHSCNVHELDFAFIKCSLECIF